jgi:hypothetical protein
MVGSAILEKCFGCKWKSSMADGRVSTVSARCSGHPREMTDGRWRKEGDEMSCHANIHMS